MSEAVVDRILIAIGLDTKQVDKGVATVQNKLVTGLSGIASKLFAPLLAGVTLSFGAIFDSINSEMKQMNALSKATHTNIEDMTAWARAVNMSGGDIEAFQGTLMTLNQNLTRIAVTGHSRIKPFFEALGLDAVELAKKPVLESLSAIGKAIDGMDKRQSANMLSSMGFDKGTIKLLQSGEKGMKQLIARQKELGVYTAKDAKALAAMNKGFKEITSAIKTLFIPVFSRIISAASKVTKYLTNAVLFLRKNITALKKAVLILAVAFSGQLYKAVIGFFQALSVSPVMKVITVIGTLLLMIEDLYVYANNGNSAFEDLWKSMGKPEDIAKGFKAVGDAINTIVKFLSKLDGADVVLLGLLTAVAPAIISAIVGAFVTAAGAIPIIIGGAIIAAIAFIYNFKDEIVEAVVVGFTVAGKMIVSIFSAIATVILEVIESTGNTIRSIFSAVGNAIGNALSSAADTARSAWDSFISWLEEKWNWIKSIMPDITGIVNAIPGVGKIKQFIGGGTTTNNNSTTSTDNSKKIYNVNLSGAAATQTFMQNSGYTPQANGGVVP